MQDLFKALTNPKKPTKKLQNKLDERFLEVLSKGEVFFRQSESIEIQTKEDGVKIVIYRKRDKRGSVVQEFEGELVFSKITINKK